MRLRYTCSVLTILFVFADLQAVHAQADDPAFQPKVKPDLHINRTPSDIKIDGKLDEAAWLSAARITGFSEIQPREMAEPPVRTEAFVTYDETHMYVAFRAHDDPSTVRASLSNRDEIFQDDFVGIILDTFGDAAQAFEIFANPLGVQGDLLMTSKNEDPGFDIIYDTAGRLTDDGFAVEMAIPFGSLRFPSQEQQTWKITFIRSHPRDSRRIYSWAAVSQDNPCLLCQTGTLYGISDIKAGTKLEIMPALVGSQSGSLADAEDPATRFDNARIAPEASLNLRYNLTSNVSAEAALNPDFSQIESDAAQIDVNETFALFYPERRPFFQEGSDLFHTYMDVIYTRTINDPIGAAKMTGRMGQTSVSFVSAVDEHTPLLLPFEERSELVEGGRSISNILRARRTFGENSFVGAAVTDRQLLDGGAGSVVSADMNVQFLKNYVIEAQAALSRTAEPVNSDLSDSYDDGIFGGDHTAALDGEDYLGNGMFVSLDRRAKHWGFDIGYMSHSPTFRAANGFVTRNNYRTGWFTQSYDLYPDNGFVDRLTPNVAIRRSYNFDGDMKLSSITPSIYGLLKGQTFFRLDYAFSSERFAETRFEHLRSWTAGFESRFSKWMSASLFATGGREIARFLDEPEVGREFGVNAGLEFKPTQRLVIEPSFSFSSLRDVETDESFFKGYILRTQTSFQFTRELSTRVIVQYNDFSGQLDVEPLVAYKLNPFSVFYVGSTHDVVNFDGPYGLTETNRQLFFKLQYLIRR